MVRGVCFILLLSTVLALLSCSTSDNPAELATDLQFAPGGELSWPPPGSPARTASASHYNFLGTDYSLEGGPYNAPDPSGDIFILAMDPGQSSFAVYPMAIPAGEHPVKLTMSVGSNDDLVTPIDPPLPYWIGVANFAEQRWDFRGPYTVHDGEYIYSFGATRETYVSATDTAYSAIVVYDDGDPPVNRYPAIFSGSLEISGSTANVPPLADLYPSAEVVLIGDSPTWIASNSTDTDGTITDYEWDFDDDGLFNEAGTEEETARGQSEYSISYVGQPYNVTVNVRVTDDDGATDTATASLRVNQNPLVFLGPLGLKVTAGGLATVHVTSEQDDDGTIEEILWDFDEDGVFNEAGEEAAAYDLRSVNLTVPGPGPLMVKCRAIDNDGGTGESFLGITGTGWATYSVFPVSGGTHPESLDIVGGNNGPFIVFVSNGELVLSRGNEEGSGWSANALATVGTNHAACSLAIVQNNPAAAYYDSVANDLYYTWSSSPSGSNLADWTHVGVDTLAWEVGQFCDLELVNGYPAIACFDATNNVPFYAYSHELDGLGSWGGYPVEGSTITGVEPSLASVNGRPVMCYSDYTSFLHRYAHTTKLQGLPVATWFAQDRSLAGQSYLTTKMLQAGTYPLYCKITTDGRGLKIYKGADLAGSSWQDYDIKTFTLVNFLGQFDAAFIGGLPVAAALMVSPMDEITIWRSQTADGMGAPWSYAGDPLPVSSTSDTELAICEYKHGIALAYYDPGESKVKYSYLYE